MERPVIRILVVDDFAPWRRYVRSTLQNRLENFQIVGEASNGAEGVERAQELCPDLILLDISLPTLDGIEAARRISGCVPNAKILFVSENRSRAVAEAALRAGGRAYVVKSQAARELLPAVAAVLQCKGFVSAGLVDHRPTNVEAQRQARKAVGRHRHEAGFYSDDQQL